MSSIIRTLEHVLDIRRAKGFPLDEHLQPGLSRETIDTLTGSLPFTLPEELYLLYQWRNGIPEESEFYFLFRDHRFLPLKEALREYQEMMAYYPPVDDEIDVHLCFPFAGFEGSVYCLPSETHPPISGRTRPVLSVFEGVEPYFSSFAACVETVAAWFEVGNHTPEGVEIAPDTELRIWKRYNPGLFE